MSPVAPVDPSEVVLTGETSRWQSRALDLTGSTAAPSLAAERRRRREVSDVLALEFSRPPDAAAVWKDHSMGPDGLTVRECRPSGTAGLRPAYVYLHGGAFWHGSAYELVNESLVSERSVRTGAVCFVPEYRLAPESGCPAAIDDTVAVVEWIWREARALGIDRGSIILGGVSAGGSIAAAAAGRLSAGRMLRGLLLEVPALDLRPDGAWEERYASANGLESPGEMARLYGGDLRHTHPDVSPLLIEDLSGFPPTHVATAQYDPFGRGGEAFAARLRGSGVTVTSTRHGGALHGSIGLTARDPVAQAWQDDVCSALGRLS